MTEGLPQPSPGYFLGYDESGNVWLMWFVGQTLYVTGKGRDEEPAWFMLGDKQKLITRHERVGK